MLDLSTAGTNTQTLPTQRPYRAKRILPATQCRAHTGKPPQTRPDNTSTGQPPGRAHRSNYSDHFSQLPQLTFLQPVTTSRHVRHTAGISSSRDLSATAQETFRGRCQPSGFQCRQHAAPLHPGQPASRKSCPMDPFTMRRRVQSENDGPEAWQRTRRRRDMVHYRTVSPVNSCRSSASIV